MKTLITLCVAALFCWCAESNAQPNVQTRIVVQGLTVPWDMVWGPDNWIWFTEKGGRVSKVDPATGQKVVLHTGIPGVRGDGESGLLGLALHPNMVDSPYVYVTYNFTNSQQNTNNMERISRFTVVNNALVNEYILIDSIEGKSNTNHQGSRLWINADRTMFVTMGDAGPTHDWPQRDERLRGKILKINLDGSAAADNPIPGNRMWSKGHRNPQGFVILPNGMIYSSEHGPDSDDELNLIEKGRNYGWPNVAGFCNTQNEIAFCDINNVVEPLYAWTPTTAVCGLDYYSADKTLIPGFQNCLLLCNLKEQDLRIIRLDDNFRPLPNHTILFNNQFGRLRDVLVAPNGKVYICNNNTGNDRIIEIIPVPGAIDENDDQGSLRVSPAPASDGFTVKSNHKGNARIRLCDAAGRQVYESVAHEGSDHWVPLRNIPAGVYTCISESVSGTSAVQVPVIR